MLKKSERFSRSRFSKKPFKRRDFAFGSVSFIEGDPGVAVVVSKKTCPTAVARNRVRRRIYAIVRPILRNGSIKGGIVIYPKRAALDASHEELRRALENALASRG